MSTISALSSATPAAARPAASGEPQPDLVVDRLEPSDYFVDPGDRVNFDFTIRNAGTADAPAFDVQLSGWGMDRETFRVEKGLKAGESLSFEDVGNLRGDPWSEYYFAEVRVDTRKEVAESNERNNKRSVTMMGRPIPRPPVPPVPVPPRPRP